MLGPSRSAIARHGTSLLAIALVVLVGTAPDAHAEGVSAARSNNGDDPTRVVPAALSRASSLARCRPSEEMRFRYMCA